MRRACAFALALLVSTCAVRCEGPQEVGEDEDVVTPLPTVAPTPVPTLGAGSVQVSPVDGAEMVYVPAGTFVMGMEDPRGVSRSHAVDLRPPQDVYLDAFWIDRTEVSNAMYACCVEAGVCGRPVAPLLATRPDYYENQDYADFPVVGVSWQDAVSYCEWVGRRLPTEAEWEKAARGDDGRPYPWGNEPPRCDLVNFVACGRDTMAVGSLPAGASPYGALDMAGNAWEWTADWYEPVAYATLPPHEGQDHPPEALHVVRGGSWVEDANSIVSAFRFFGYPIDSITIGFGFRCARGP